MEKNVRVPLRTSKLCGIVSGFRTPWRKTTVLVVCLSDVITYIRNKLDLSNGAHLLFC